MLNHSTIKRRVLCFFLKLFVYGFGLNVEPVMTFMSDGPEGSRHKNFLLML